ncbi:MAG: hypothetical protein AB8G23_08610 [Myxococcota bacterium]
MARSLWSVAGALAIVLVLLLLAIPVWIFWLAPGDLEEPTDGDLVAAAVVRSNGGPVHRTLALLDRELDGFDQERMYAALERFREGDFEAAAWVEEQSLRQVGLREAVLEIGVSSEGGTPEAEDRDRPEAAIDQRGEGRGSMGLLGLVRVASAKALLLEREGRLDEAFELAIYGLRVGRVLSAHPDIALVEMMMSGAVQGVSVTSVEDLSSRHPISSEKARFLSSQLAAAKASPDSWRRMWANEFLGYRALLLQAFEHRTNSKGLVDLGGDGGASLLVRVVPERYLIHRNRTVSAIAADYRERRAQTGQDCLSIYSQRPKETAAFGGLSMHFRPNSVGELLVRIAQPNFDRFELRRCAVEAKLALAQVFVAARAYAAAEGELPESLDLLVPRFITRLPANPYQGGALAYSKADRKIVAAVDELAAVLGAERSSWIAESLSERSLDWGTAAHP